MSFIGFHVIWNSSNANRFHGLTAHINWTCLFADLLDWGMALIFFFIIVFLWITHNSMFLFYICRINPFLSFIEFNADWSGLMIWNNFIRLFMKSAVRFVDKQRFADMFQLFVSESCNCGSSDTILCWKKVGSESSLCFYVMAILNIYHSKCL